MTTKPNRSYRRRGHAAALLALVSAMAAAVMPGTTYAQNGADYFQEVWARVDMAEPYGNAMGFDPVSQTLAIGRVGGTLTDRHIMLYQGSNGQPATPPYLSETPFTYAGLGGFSIAGRPDGGFMAVVDTVGLVTWNTIDQAEGYVQNWGGAFSRNMKIEGTAPELSIFSIGASDSGPATVQTSTDGVDFAYLMDIGGMAPLPPTGKAGVAASGPHPAQVVIGTDAVGGPDLDGAHIHFWNPDLNNYEYHGDFRPMSFEGIPRDAAVDCAIDGETDAAFFLVRPSTGSSTTPPTDPSHLLAVKLSDLGNEIGEVVKEDGTVVDFTVIDVTELGRYQIPGVGGVGLRGTVALDRANKIAYWYSRSINNLNGFGAVRYGGQVQPPEPPEITAIATTGPNTLRITYQSTAATNTIQATTDLTDPLTWAPVTGATEPGPGQFDVPVPTSPTMHYYRILGE